MYNYRLILLWKGQCGSFADLTSRLWKTDYYEARGKMVYPWGIWPSGRKGDHHLHDHGTVLWKNFPVPEQAATSWTGLNDGWMIVHQFSDTMWRIWAGYTINMVWTTKDYKNRRMESNGRQRLHSHHYRSSGYSGRTSWASSYNDEGFSWNCGKRRQLQERETEGPKPVLWSTAKDRTHYPNLGSYDKAWHTSGGTSHDWYTA